VFSWARGGCIVVEVEERKVVWGGGWWLGCHGHRMLIFADRDDNAVNVSSGGKSGIGFPFGLLSRFVADQRGDR